MERPRWCPNGYTNWDKRGAIDSGEHPTDASLVSQYGQCLGDQNLPIEIRPIPAVPAGLIEAATRTTLVPFVGAGVSQLAGCPRWSEFADRALDSLVAQKALTAAQRSQLGGLSPRVKLSVAKLTARRKGVTIDYRGILQKTKDWSADPDGRRVYSHISALSSKFVTTNYDEWLDIALPPFELSPEQPKTKTDRREEQRRTKLHLPSEITADNFLPPNTVVHLHGALADQENMVLSTSDYIRRYANDRRREEGDEENQVLRFLEFLFREKTVLFLGYGLEELEILEYVVMKARGTARQRNVAQHYLLQGFFSFEAEICASLQDYFLQECGIELIPFSRDEKDWMQLIDVLESFAKALPTNDELVVQQLAEMEELARG